MNTIAIDCGASFVKAALFDENGAVLTMLKQTSPCVHQNEDIFSPVQISSLVPIVKNLISQLCKGLESVKLCISNEMHGFILADESGKPFTDYISWQKEYGLIKINGKSSLDILTDSSFYEYVQNSGMKIRGGLPSSNLLYLIRSKSLIRNKEQKLYFYTLGDYLIKIITNQDIICHPTNAAATGLFNINTGKWNNDFIRAICAENIVFSKIGNDKLSVLFDGCNLNVLPAIGDQQAALLGAGLKDEYDLSFNLGTGAQVTQLTKKIELSDNWQTRPFFHNFYLKTIPHLPSGRAMNVYVRFFKDILEKFGYEISDEKLWNVLLEQEKKAESTELKCDLSFFQNPITEDTVGKITNISEYGLNLGTLMKAVFSKMAENFLIAAKTIQLDTNLVKRIVFSGGVAKRIESIRKKILDSYNNVIVAPIIESETLFGLYKYGISL